ncbi:antibiotic resistance protein MarC [Salmonella enterica subsp. enterica serovar Typhi]|nr:antibiotic resistance protein MarC [Salmonella enterica subsp. enterica serovar Typhi]
MIQPLFDFPVYFKFFIGLFALVNPVGIIPVFISMTSYQTATARNKTNLTANLSVAIILWSSLFLGDGILQLFGISIDSFRIAGGILVVTIAMSITASRICLVFQLPLRFLRFAAGACSVWRRGWFVCWGKPVSTLLPESWGCC